MAKRGAVEAFAQVVREYRLERGWSQEELAFQAGVHRNYVSGIERGIRNPSLTVLFALADALGVSPSSLVSKVERQVR